MDEASSYTQTLGILPLWVGHAGAWIKHFITFWNSEIKPPHNTICVSKMLENDARVALQDQPSPPQDVLTRPPWHHFWWWHPCPQGSGSHLAVPGSDLSNQMELAKHHTSASVHRGSVETGRARKHSGWEVCRWLITTRVCLPHFLLRIFFLN